MGGLCALAAMGSRGSLAALARACPAPLTALAPLAALAPLTAPAPRGRPLGGICNRRLSAEILHHWAFSYTFMLLQEIYALCRKIYAAKKDLRQKQEIYAQKTGTI